MRSQSGDKFDLSVAAEDYRKDKKHVPTVFEEGPRVGLAKPRNLTRDCQNVLLRVGSMLKAKR